MKIPFRLLSPLLFLIPFGLTAQAPVKLQVEDAQKKFTASFHLLTQVRHEFRVNDGSLRNANGFALRSLRPAVRGEARDFNTSFFVQAEFGANATNANARVLDAEVTWEANEWFDLRLGQFAVPWNMEFGVSLSRQQFVDRSGGHALFTLDRDIGLSLESQWMDGRLRKSLSLVNGDGANTVSGDSSMLIAAKSEFDILGRVGNSIVDLARSREMKLTAATALAFDFGNQNLGGVGSALNGNKLFRALAHAIFQYQGFGAGLEGHFVRNFENKENDMGLIAQAGYLIYRDEFEVAARYAGAFNGDGSALLATDESQHELTGGLNYYYMTHFMKVQADYSLFLNANGTKDRTDHRLRTQLQFMF